eukprot:snap_masked-scaffold_58-processed-gene-0.60-mRNA-1 protein AED:1.00 eAED:1.00 QI:0/0/0/0/1/1/2/0/453
MIKLAGMVSVADNVNAGIPIDKKLQNIITSGINSENPKVIEVTFSEKQISGTQTQLKATPFPQSLNSLRSKVKVKQPNLFIYCVEPTHILLVTYLPSTAAVKDKMLFSTSRQPVKNFLLQHDQIKVVEEYNCSELKQLNNMAFEKFKAREKPMTEHEKLRIEQDNEETAGGYSFLARFKDVSTGNVAPGSPGVKLPGLEESSASAIYRGKQKNSYIQSPKPKTVWKKKTSPKITVSTTPNVVSSYSQKQLNKSFLSKAQKKEDTSVNLFADGSAPLRKSSIGKDEFSSRLARWNNSEVQRTPAKKNKSVKQRANPYTKQPSKRKVSSRQPRQQKQVCEVTYHRVKGTLESRKLSAAEMKTYFPNEVLYNVCVDKLYLVKRYIEGEKGVNKFCMVSVGDTLVIFNPHEENTSYLHQSKFPSGVNKTYVCKSPKQLTGIQYYKKQDRNKKLLGEL